MAKEPTLSTLAQRRRALVSRTLQLAERLAYYELEVPLLAPWDDLAEVLDADAEATLYRFVDQGGSLVVLRGDLTPVVARQIAKLQGRATEATRVAYAKSLARRRLGLSSDRTEAYEVGCELIGPAGLYADLEVAALSLLLLEELGVEDVELHMGDVRISESVLAAAFKSPASITAAREALDFRDPDDLNRLAAEEGVDSRLADALHSLCALTPAEHELVSLERLGDPDLDHVIYGLRQRVELLRRLMPEATVKLDLGVRDDRGYYTGMRFRLQGAGVSAVLGGGGRYDRLLAHFGVDRPAAGFSLRLDRIIDLLSPSAGDLEAAGRHEERAADFEGLSAALGAARAGGAAKLSYDKEQP